MSVSEVQGQTTMGKEECKSQAIVLKEEGKSQALLKEEGKSQAILKEEAVARLVKEYEGKLTILKAEHSRDIEVGVGADGSSREAIRRGGLWKFLTVRQTYPLGNQR